MRGAIQLKGTGWTVAAMVAKHTGMPFLIPIEGDSYGQYDSFMPGVCSLGYILQREGYNQTLLVGSDAEYGGRKAFYEQHGNFKILDLYTAWKEGIVPDGRKVWWGFEDERLYAYAKKELERLSAQNEPFNLTMLTVDTHHVCGYVCPLCDDEYEQPYWNVIRCASRQLQEFLDWLQEQDFYENTTIVIVGDHLSMDTIVLETAGEEYCRTTYNAFVNSVKNPENTKNRVFSSMDLFPTTLSAMGVEIEGDRLGVGTDLFSKTPTLLETYDIQTVDDGLLGHSSKYNAILYKKR